MDAYSKGAFIMSYKFNPYLSVGIDVGADFSMMSMALPNQQLIAKPFKIIHNRLDSLSSAVSRIKKAEELNSLKAHIFLESTGIYHFPLFCYLKEAGFDVFVINPLISNSSRNMNIRKVHNDKFDSKKAALLGLNPNLKVSLVPTDLVLNLRNLTREYFNLVDSRSAYVNKLLGQLRQAFPQFLGIFSKVTGKTSLMILQEYTTPQNILSANKEKLIASIAKISRKGISTATKKYEKLTKAAREASVFGHAVDSNFYLIQHYIGFIQKYDAEINHLLEQMHQFVDTHEDEPFVKQIHLIESFKGAGFLSAVTLMCEIGDFSAFQKPKQLYAYFGLDPEVKQSGNFNGTNVKISKRGSRLARRTIFTMALQSISRDRKGRATNPVLRSYYLKKCQSKPKMVALGAVMHKVCNIIFAILRDNKPFEIRTPEEHCLKYTKFKLQAA
jgi:transposase